MISLAKDCLFTILLCVSHIVIVYSKVSVDFLLFTVESYVGTDRRNIFSDFFKFYCSVSCAPKGGPEFPKIGIPENYDKNSDFRRNLRSGVKRTGNRKVQLSFQV